jgi:hydroxymethylglutaryl-CoA reductase
MENKKKFYQLSWSKRLATLNAQQKLTTAQQKLLEKHAVDPQLSDQQIENYLTNYNLPEGLAFHYLINGKKYLVPLVTEEPSVIAASSHGAGLVEKAGGFQAQTTAHLLWGQIIIEQLTDPMGLKKRLQAKQAELLAAADSGHPSLKKRGGGARLLRIRILGEKVLSVDLGIDTQEAMGANLVNSMLESLAQKIKQQFSCQVLMSILSNLADECLATAECELPVELLAKKGFAGLKTAQKITAAAKIAQLDPYRAATHNKGIMNGVDAAVIAMGNDWRAIESAVHAYAARDGYYRGLSSWVLSPDQKKLCGKLTLPLPVGFVGGSISILPLVKFNQQLAGIKSVAELEKVIVCVGLAQNLAALLALVTEGIQQGHMRLQLRSTALAAGATIAEADQVAILLQQQRQTDLASAKQILQNLRGNGDQK